MYFRLAKGRKKVATIVEFVKVLSVAGNAGSVNNQSRAAVTDNTTLTLLVQEYDAKRIELARTLGELSLTLAGYTAVPTTEQKPAKAVGIADLVEDYSEGDDSQIDGRMCYTDNITKQIVCYELTNRKWTRVD